MESVMADSGGSDAVGSRHLCGEAPTGAAALRAKGPRCSSSINVNNPGSRYPVYDRFGSPIISIWPNNSIWNYDNCFTAARGISWQDRGCDCFG